MNPACHEMPDVLITGATGKLGPLLASELLQYGFQVRVLTRDLLAAQLSLGSLFSKVDVIVGDVTDLESVSRAVSGVNLVFHLAALLHINVPDDAIQREYERINVDGTRHVIQASQKWGVERMIFFSTIAVYGPGHWGSVFDELSPCNPQSKYAESKAKAEKMIAEVNLTTVTGPWITVLRLASVYGTRVTGNYKRLICAVEHGFFCIPSVGSIEHGKRKIHFDGACRTLIHEEDVVSGALLAAIHPRAKGKTYNLTDGMVHSLQSIVQSMATGLSKSVILLRVPSGPLHFFSLVSKNISHRLPHFMTHPLLNMAYVLDKLMECCGVDGQKIQSELGFVPQYDLIRGWRQAVNKVSSGSSAIDDMN